MSAAASSATTPRDASFHERHAWLALALTPGIGPRRILRAVERCGCADHVLHLPLTELEALEFPAAAAQFIASGEAAKSADEELEKLAATGAAILTYHDEAYPERLRQIYDPPALLWLRGNASLLSRPIIAVVGTRHPTPYGTGMAEMLSRDLALRGIIILSGMARGVDTAAHKGAIAAGKPNVAVWGTGIDVVYPKENKSLAEQIIAGGGAILSELPLGTFPAPQNFPRRNRILSGMSVGVLVIEAAEYSGTRVTARCALEQNRDVYAVPGNVTNKNSWGPNLLIKQGAKLTSTWEDVWEDLPTDIRMALEQSEGFASEGSSLASLFDGTPLPPSEARIFSVLRHDEALQMDEILEKVEPEMSSSEVFTALFELELAGRIRQLPGRNYVRSF
ncbi:MAG TPA: DNA-processing protein DprA [Acidobacteriaceae bacterium]|jgi:DNA processing protein|nr:DNA-processing protein DprA [Acidobacteriaceae bacterium]